MHKSVKPIHNCSKHLRVFCTHASSYTFYNSCAHIPQPEVERRGKIFRRDPISSSNLSIIYIYIHGHARLYPLHIIFLYMHMYINVYIYIIYRYMYMGYMAISQIYTIVWMPATSSSHSVGYRNSNCRIERFV